MAETQKSTTERVLRIGVIQGVQVIEERILRKKGPVTFGTGDGNTFVLAGSDLPKSIVVFDSNAEGYQLVLNDEMQGRLEGPTGKQDFTQLRATATKKDGVFRHPIADSSKGRVKLSPEITVLFHFVVAPVVAPIPEMPPEVRGGLVKSFEPIFTAVLTASFLVHSAFGLFVKFTEPPAPPSLEDLRELVERIQPPKVEVKLPPIKVATPTPNSTGPAVVEDTDTGTGSSGPPEKGGGGGGKGKGKGSGGIGDRNAIREGIAGKGILQLIGGRGGGGGDGAVGSVFGSGAGISDDIGGALAGTAGVGIAGGAGGGAGVTRRGTGGGGGGGDGSGEGGSAVGIGDLKTEGGGKVDTGAKTATKIVARVKSDDLEAVDGKIDKKSVAATIRRRQDGFQACYETALKANSKLAGKIVVEFTIGDDGKVTEARVVKDTMNSGETNNCVVSLLKRLRFPAPSDGEVTINNTFVFQPGG